MKILASIKNYFKEKPLRLTQSVILFTGIVLIFSYLFFFKSSMESVRETAVFLRLGIAETTKAEIENFLSENIDSLSNLGKKFEFIEDQSERKSLIEELMRERGWITDILIADREGMEILRVSKFSISDPEKMRNVANLEEFKSAKSGNISFGEPYLNDKSVPVFPISLPLQKNDRETSGVLIAQLSLQEIWNLISESKLITSGQKLYIVDSEGFLISHPDISLALKNINLLEKSYVNEVIRNRKTVEGRQYPGINGAPLTIVGIPMEKNLGWGIFIEEPSKTAMASYDKIKTAAIIFIFLTFILLVILIINSQTLASVFSDFKEEVKKRTRELKELDKTTKLLVKRDLELSEANNRLEELDSVKSDFVSIAAHQLRTPLTGIKWSFIALLEKETGTLNSEQKKIVDSGLEAINHTIILINDLLNVAHIEEGRFGFNFKKTEVLPLVQKSFERFGSLAGEKGVWLNENITAKKIPSLNLDPEKISLALDNLLDNAIKYTNPGGKVTIEVSYENKAVKIAVSDTGIGIPKIQFDRVFTKFFRAENALLFQTTGSGLGLYMVKNIVDRHCGTISVKSEENKGTTFVITLPEACNI